MKKLSSLLVLCALSFVACGGSNEVAATVDGVDVTVGDVEALVSKVEDTTISKEEFASFLSFNIVLEIFARQAEADFGITFTDEEIAAEADEIVTIELAKLAEGKTREEFLKENEVTEQLLQQIAHQSLIQAGVLDAIKADLQPPTQEEIDTQRTQSAADLTQVCAAHILVATEAEAQDVLTRLEGGEEFADLAAELSTDTGSGAQGGDLGCQAAGGYVPEFATAALAAELGVATDPVLSEFGYHVLLVSERTEALPGELPTEDEVIELLLNQAATPASNDWFIAAASGADVEVNEKYGTWQAEPTPGVVPPAE
ncbi:MAG: peptidylprolyl isomerase [Acidimicrobiia bacterium]